MCVLSMYVYNFGDEGGGVGEVGAPAPRSISGLWKRFGKTEEESMGTCPLRDSDNNNNDN